MVFVRLFCIHYRVTTRVILDAEPGHDPAIQQLCASPQAGAALVAGSSVDKARHWAHPPDALVVLFLQRNVVAVEVLFFWFLLTT